MTTSENKKKYKCETCKGKAFSNWSANRIHMTLPNGNHLSTVWGEGTYSDNYNERSVYPPGDKGTFRSSDTVEIMFDCPEKLRKKILKLFNEGDEMPVAYLSFDRLVKNFKYACKVTMTPQEHTQKIEARIYVPEYRMGWWGGLDTRPRCSVDKKVVFDERGAKRSADKATERGTPMKSYKGRCGFWHTSRIR